MKMLYIFDGFLCNIARISLPFKIIDFSGKKQLNHAGCTLHNSDLRYSEVFFHTCYLESALNIVVRWLTLLLHIRDVPGSNISPETGCPD
jgi:hypothetical protein